MKGKIVGIFVLMLLLITAYPIMGVGVIDQSQETQNGYAYLSRYVYHAQSFKPTMSPLDKVSLRLKTYHYNTDIKVSIKDNLNGPNLRSKTISTSDIYPEYGWTWVEFDFEPDIVVAIGYQYYIEVEHYSAGDIDLVAWAYSDSNSYANGEAWGTTSLFPSQSWQTMSNTDFCFRTYRENQNPNNPYCFYDRRNDELVISATDPNGDMVQYGVSWLDDMRVDDWTELVPSGTEKRIDCSGRQFTAGVIVRDEYESYSQWASVNPKNKYILNKENDIDQYSKNSYNVGSINVNDYDISITPDDVEIKILKSQLPKYITLTVDYVLDQRGTDCTGYCSMEIVDGSEIDEKSTTSWDEGELHINYLAFDGDNIRVELIGGWQCQMSSAEDRDFVYVTVTGIRGKNNYEGGTNLIINFLENHPNLFPLIRQILGLKI